MKRSLLLLGMLVALSCTAAPARAQTLYLHGGADIPSSSALNDNQKVGFNLGAGVGVPLTSSGLEVLIRGSVDRFENDRGGVGNFVAYSGTINLKGNAPMRSNRWMPYLLAGGGLFHLGEDDVLDTEAGLQFGAGLGIRTTKRAHLFVEPNYVLVFTEGNNTQYVPIRLGGAVRF